MRPIRNAGRRSIRLLTLLLLCSLGSVVAAQRTVLVEDPRALTLALQQVPPGTVIELAEGSYGPLIIQGIEARPDARITLRPVSETDRVEFSRLDMRDSSYVTIDGVTFDYDFTEGDAPDLRPFEIGTSRGIHITNSVFDGDDALGISKALDGFPTAFGLSLRGVADMLLSGNEIRGFKRGLIAAQSGGLTVEDNILHDLRMDGMNFAQVQAVRILGNHIHSFRRSLLSDDHADMIQFWTNRTRVPSSDIVIRDNVLNSGRGYFTQSIFMRNDLVDRGIAGKEMYYRDVVIENNVILNAHLNGISVGATQGLTIRNNTVLHNATSDGTKVDAGLWIPQIRAYPASEDVRISGNIASVVGGFEGQTDWIVEDNLLVQDRDPAAENYYDAFFLAARTGAPEDLISFSYLPGSGADGRTVGSSLLIHPESSQQLAPAIRVIGDEPFVNRFVFDAGATVGPPDLLNANTTFEWRIGRNTVLEGPRVTHTFSEPGHHEATLIVTPQGGMPRQTSVTLDVPNMDVITFTAKEGVFRAWEGSNSMRAIGTPSGVGPAVLNTGRARISIDREHLRPFFSASDFELSMRIRAADSYRSAGELLRIHKTMVIDVTGRGTLDMVLMTETADRLRVKTPARGLTDGEWHDIRIVYSSAREMLEIFIDGQIAGSGQTTGTIRPIEHWGIELGHPFNNRKSFDGELQQFRLRANVEAFAPS